MHLFRQYPFSEKKKTLRPANLSAVITSNFFEIITFLRRHYPDQVPGFRVKTHSQPAQLPAPLKLSP